MSGAVCANALRARGRVLDALSGTAATQRRCFSSTQFRQASKIIHFTKCSSPELDGTLKTIREELILPMYLPPESRKKIYSAKHKANLERDPITVEIDGDLIKFGYRDMMKLPNTHHLMIDAVKAMKTPADFNNLWPLLEGVMGQASRKLKPSILQRIVRRAAEAHSLQNVMDCFQGARKTQLRLTNHELVATLFFYIQREALLSGWAEGPTAKALKRIQLALDLMEGDPEHKVKPRPGEDLPFAFPFYRDPLFLAARLHLEAARASKQKGGKDVDGLVTKHAQQLVKLWPETAGVLGLQPESAYTNDGVKYLVKPDSTVMFGAMAISALRLAAKVVEPTLAAQLESRAALAEKEVKAALPNASSARQAYKELFPEEQLEEKVKAE